ARVEHADGRTRVAPGADARRRARARAGPLPARHRQPHARRHAAARHSVPRSAASDPRASRIERESTVRPLRVERKPRAGPTEVTQGGPMTIVRLLKMFIHTIAAFLVFAATAGTAAAQGHDDHGGPGASAPATLTAEQNALVQAVREATERFKD